MKSKSLLALLLALALCLGLAACGSKGASEDPGANDAAQAGPETPEEPEATFPAAEIGTDLGNGIADFTFTTYDGQTHSLYETLKEKKMVLINLWATWCGPCQMEFPFMEEAYEKYKDDIEIFALSVEEEDADDVLAAYVAEMGMTFPVGRDTPDLGSNSFNLGGIPTSVVVDRFGTICFVEVGSITSAEAFQRLFDTFVGDSYTESVLLPDGVPPAVPDVEAADPAELSAVLGGGFTCVNPADEYNWPLIVDGECLVTTNAGQTNAHSSLDVEVTASAGDVFAVDYATSCEAIYDLMVISVNGEPVKYSSGEHNWATYAYAFASDGTYTVTLSFEKDDYGDEGDDVIRFKNARLLSGDEGAAALAGMPVYPHAEETALTVSTANAREVVINDPTGTLEGSFGDVKWYIIPGDAASFSATLAEGLDAECASFFSYYDGDVLALSDCVAGDRYEFTTNGIDSYEATGAGYCYVELTPSISDAPVAVYFFNDEANLNAFLARNFTEDNGVLSVTWKYADGSAPESAAVSEGVDALAEGNSLYYLAFVDQNGDPVEGVTANVCDDSACTPMKSDANGIVAFSYPSFAYHIQVIKIPDGYEYDLSAETYIDAEGGVTEFVVTKA